MRRGALWIVKYAPLKFVFILSKASSSVVVGIVTIDDLVSLFPITYTRTKNILLKPLKYLNRQWMKTFTYLFFINNPCQEQVVKIVMCLLHG